MLQECCPGDARIIIVVVSLVYEVITILYVRNDAEAQLWKEEQFEQGI